MDKHSELELKFKADGIDFKVFNKYMLKHAGFNSSKIYTASPDVYYKQGDSVIRHRQNGENGGELTVKQRKDDDSIVDRVEIDLKFAEGTTERDVTAFLLATGWVERLDLNKWSHIYTVRRNGITSILAFYTVEEYSGLEVNPPRDFIEVEIDKENEISEQQALDELNWWKKDLQFNLGLGEPINQSLYEIYTGERYVKKSA